MPSNKKSSSIKVLVAVHVAACLWNGPVVEAFHQQTVSPSTNTNNHSNMHHRHTSLSLQSKSSSSSSLHYRKGDAEDTDRHRKEHDEAARTLAAHNNPGGFHWFGLFGKKKSVTAVRTTAEDYDLDAYLQYVNRRYERLHLDDDDDQESVHKLQRSSSSFSSSSSSSNSSSNASHGGWQHFFNVHAHKGAPSAQQHFDAMYALNWAGHAAEQIHEPWTNDDAAATVRSSVAAEDEQAVAPPRLGMKSKASSRLGSLERLVFTPRVCDILCQVRSVHSKFLAAQRRVIVSVLEMVIRRVEALVKFVHLVETKRVQAALGLTLMLSIYVVRPVLKPTKA